MTVRGTRHTAQRRLGPREWYRQGKKKIECSERLRVLGAEAESGPPSPWGHPGKRVSGPICERAGQSATSEGRLCPPGGVGVQGEVTRISTCHRGAEAAPGKNPWAQRFFPSFPNHPDPSGPTASVSDAGPRAGGRMRVWSWRRAAKPSPWGGSSCCPSPNLHDSGGQCPCSETAFRGGGRPLGVHL